MHLEVSSAVLDLAWALLHFLWQGALLGLLAWAGLWLLRRRGPRIRYGFACVLLLMMAALPPLTYLWLRAQTPPVAELPLLALPPAASGTIGHRLEALLLPWLPWLLATYSLGVLGLATRLAGSWAWLQTYRWRGVQPAAPHWQAAARNLALRLGLRREVRILDSARVNTPMALGILKPVVLVPSAVLLGLDPRALEAILAHELAHVRRHDYLVNLLQSLLETLLFYHPAVWWLSRQIRVERELCCDDLAVALCGDPLLYSKALARLEELREAGCPPPHLATAADGGSLMNRIQRLLIPTLIPVFPYRTALLSTLSAGALAAAGLAYAQQAPPAPVAKAGEAQTLLIDKAGPDPGSAAPKAALPEGAHIRIKVREEGKDKLLEIRREGGKEIRTYTEDGKEAPIDPKLEAELQRDLAAEDGQDADGADGQKRVLLFKHLGKGAPRADIQIFKGPGQGAFIPDLDLLRKEIQTSLEKNLKSARGARTLTPEESRKLEEEAKRFSEQAVQQALEKVQHALPMVPPEAELDLEAFARANADRAGVLAPGAKDGPGRRIVIRKHRQVQDPKAELEDLQRDMEDLKQRMEHLQKELQAPKPGAGVAQPKSH